MYVYFFFVIGSGQSSVCRDCKSRRMYVHDRHVECMMCCMYEARSQCGTNDERGLGTSLINNY